MKPVLAALLALAFVPSSAQAALGELSYDGCVSDSNANGCVDLPNNPIQGAEGVAVSPDGRSLYVVGYHGGSISHFFRDPLTGQLSLDGCLNDTGSQGCGDLPGKPLDGAAGVVVSPDGGSVYVASLNAGTVSHFFRDQVGGQLYWDGCLANDAEQGCADVQDEPLLGARQVAVSPDGASVYAVTASGGVARFAVSRPEGQISYGGCLNSDGSEHCVDLPGEPLDLATDVAVSPDGRSVYVTSFNSDSIGYLFRDAATGKLDWDGCLNNDGSDSCANVPGAPLDGANAVAVSPDGRSIYVASMVSDSISHLVPDAGALRWQGCVNGDGSQGCADAPGEPLDGAADVAVSGDGASVYAVAFDGASLSHLFRGSAGQLGWEGCLNDDGSQACADLPGAPLSQASTVAVSPEGRSVYAGAYDGAAVARFTRAPAPTPQPPPPAPSQPPVADTLAPTISRLGFRNRRLRITLSEPATVRVAIRRRRTLTHTGHAGLNRLRVKLRPGAYRARVTAVDAAGNRSQARTIRFRIRPARA
jgi:DNA-binding beta-propeller fold protein YncE